MHKLMCSQEIITHISHKLHSIITVFIRSIARTSHSLLQQVEIVKITLSQRSHHIGKVDW